MRSKSRVSEAQTGMGIIVPEEEPGTRVCRLSECGGRHAGPLLAILASRIVSLTHTLSLSREACLARSRQPSCGPLDGRVAVGRGDLAVFSPEIVSGGSFARGSLALACGAHLNSTEECPLGGKPEKRLVFFPSSLVVSLRTRYFADSHIIRAPVPVTRHTRVSHGRILAHRSDPELHFDVSGRGCCY